MKKILFVVPTLRNGGGVIRSLQNFLLNLPEGSLNVSVLPTGFSSDNIVDLKNCNILQTDFILNVISGVFSETRGYKYRTLLFVSKILLRFLAFCKLRKIVENLLLKSRAYKYSDYDVVVAFQEGACTNFVSKMSVEKKIAWIHCDYKEYYYLHKQNEYKIYSTFDSIVSVSDYTKHNFDVIYPSLKERSDYVYNYLDINYIKKLSSLKVDESDILDNRFLIISIGRIHNVKQFSRIPLIIHQMLENGVSSFKWILLGPNDDQEEYDRLQEDLVKYNIGKEHFEYLGSKMNPYSYLKHANLLVSLSKSEACPFVVNEARVLEVPVVSNNYPSIYEFIESGKNGEICTLNKMSNVLSDLISDVTKYNKLKDYMIGHPYDNKMVMRKFLNILIE